MVAGHELPSGGVRENIRFINETFSTFSVCLLLSGPRVGGETKHQSGLLPQ